MSWDHLRAMLWMRWRILVNRLKRSGKVGNVLLAVLIGLCALASMGLFMIALVLGVELMPRAKPFELMLVWLLIAFMFLMMWLVGLIMDLQRSDSMSFKNLLHLPVSLGWVFLYNYLGSYVSFSIAIFLPPMLGLSLASAIVHGPKMLICFPLVFGYIGMVTALTYQLRGWLSRLMEDKRRGRNIVAAVTFTLVVMFQLPNLVNMHFASKRSEERSARSEAASVELAQHDFELSEAEHREWDRRRRKERNEEERQEKVQVDRYVSLGAMIVPLGWLPFGVRTAFDGRILYSLLCTLGLLLVTGSSLARSFRTTLASFLGEERASPSKASDEPKLDLSGNDKPRGTLLIQRSFPFSGELASSVAAASLRSLLRAPEGKLLLLGPVILLLVFGSLLFSKSDFANFAAFAPMMTLGATMIGMLSISQVMQNQFGLDRDGFRSYVLSPLPRRLILRGKNFGLAPVAIVFGLIALVFLQLFVGLGVIHFAGACFQLLSVYMILCMIGNTTSILIPLKLKPHGMKAAKVKFTTVLWHLLSVLLIPVAISPLLIPAGIEMLFDWMQWPGGLALYFGLQLAMLAGTYTLYSWALNKQGELLQGREQEILEILTRE